MAKQPDANTSFKPPYFYKLVINWLRVFHCILPLRNSIFWEAQTPHHSKKQEIFPAAISMRKQVSYNLPVVSLIMVGLCGTLSLTALTANVDILAVRWHGFVTDYHDLAAQQCGQDCVCHGCLA